MSKGGYDGLWALLQSFYNGRILKCVRAIETDRDIICKYRLSKLYRLYNGIIQNNMLENDRHGKVKNREMTLYRFQSVSAYMLSHMLCNDIIQEKMLESECFYTLDRVSQQEWSHQPMTLCGSYGDYKMKQHRAPLFDSKLFLYKGSAYQIHAFTSYLS